MSLSKLNDRDVEWIARRLPKPVREILCERRDIFLAGGFIRACIAGEDVNDVDLFAPSSDVASLIALKLAAGTQIIKTDNAYTVLVDDVSVQVIHRWTFRTPSECLASFDFTIACAAVWFEPRSADVPVEQWVSQCDPDFYADLAAKRLIYRSPQRNEDAGGSILRVLKFYKRGYRIPLDSLGAVVARLVNAIRFDALPTGDDREKGIADVLTGLLVEVDPAIAWRQAQKTTA